MESDEVLSDTGAKIVGVQKGSAAKQCNLSKIKIPCFRKIRFRYLKIVDEL